MSHPFNPDRASGLATLLMAALPMLALALVALTTGLVAA